MMVKSVSVQKSLYDSVSLASVHTPEWSEDITFICDSQCDGQKRVNSKVTLYHIQLKRKNNDGFYARSGILVQSGGLFTRH